MWHGEIFMAVDTSGDPHVAEYPGLRVSDRTAVPVADRPLGPNIESFYCTADTNAPFLAVDADPIVGVFWWDEVPNEQA